MGPIEAIRQSRAFEKAMAEETRDQAILDGVPEAKLVNVRYLRNLHLAIASSMLLVTKLACVGDDSGRDVSGQNPPAAETQAADPCHGINAIKNSDKCPGVDPNSPDNTFQGVGSPAK